VSEVVEIRSGLRADPVGACIYCGAFEGLTDEHVIPYALRGTLVLPEATCGTCADITSAFERRVLRGFMFDARTAGNFPTRRRKDRPATRSLQVERGGTFETVELPSDESPGLLFLPMLKRPAFLTGAPPVHGVGVMGIETISFGRNPVEVVTDLGTKTMRHTVNLDVTSFVRMLAKIGYSYAIAARGPYPQSEVPVLPLILGGSDDGSTWVGSTEYRLESEEKRPEHALGLVPYTATVDGVLEHVLVARIKLFANSGATGYEVVVRRAAVVESEAGRQP
jgi:hypothetical protein